MRALLVIGLMTVISGSAEAQYRGSPSTPQSPGSFGDQGGYRGNLNANPYDPNSANPYGRNGSPFSSDTINNPMVPGAPTDKVARSLRIEIRPCRDDNPAC
jgi:hypothetical protein